jgi:hypothetical protein
LCANKPEAQFRPVSIVHGNEYNVVAGLEVLRASVGRGEAQVDAFVDTAKYPMSNDCVFHVQHNTPFGSGWQLLYYWLN